MRRCGCIDSPHRTSIPLSPAIVSRKLTGQEKFLMSRHQTDRGLLAHCLTSRHLFFLGVTLFAAFLLYQPGRRATASVTHAPDAAKSESALSTVSLPSAVSSAPAPTSIVWRAQDNPHVISGTYTIPVGTTVTMEPGVVVRIDQNSLLKIEGALIGQGTAANRIALGMANHNADISVPGTLDLTYTDISAQLDPGNNGTLLFNNCRWHDTGAFFTTDGYTYTNPPYIQFDHCRFEGANASATITNATVVMRDVAFTGGAYGRFYYVYMYLDNVRDDSGAQQWQLIMAARPRLPRRSISLSTRSHSPRQSFPAPSGQPSITARRTPKMRSP